MEQRKQINVGVLYESNEWSDHKLARELKRCFSNSYGGERFNVVLIDMQKASSVDEALGCDVLISRVFASAVFRNHENALRNMEKLIDGIDKNGIVLINAAAAHEFEIDKYEAYKALKAAGIDVPQTYAVGTPGKLLQMQPEFPCVVKPVCGGRTTYTHLAHTLEEFEGTLSSSPDIEFIVQEYVSPSHGFITRIEIAGGEVVLAVKRSVSECGLSAYRYGSTYEIYEDLPERIKCAAIHAAEVLGFAFGSFDIIETRDRFVFIDANSVSNVSEDCTEIFNMDLMAVYAEKMAEMIIGLNI